MSNSFSKPAVFFGAILSCAALFAGGYVAGQSRVGQPKTIIHVVEIKWAPGVPDAEKQRVLNGVKEVALKSPGVRNVWLKAERVEPRDFNAAFAIEFQNRDAADAYSESAAHDAWDKEYVPLREASVSIQVTNP
jgi:hypothetical protein